MMYPPTPPAGQIIMVPLNTSATQFLLLALALVAALLLGDMIFGGRK